MKKNPKMPPKVAAAIAKNMKKKKNNGSQERCKSVFRSR